MILAIVLAIVVTLGAAAAYIARRTALTKMMVEEVATLRARIESAERVALPPAKWREHPIDACPSCHRPIGRGASRCWASGCDYRLPENCYARGDAQGRTIIAVNGHKVDSEAELELCLRFHLGQTVGVEFEDGATGTALIHRSRPEVEELTALYEPQRRAEPRSPFEMVAAAVRGAAATAGPTIRGESLEAAGLNDKRYADRVIVAVDGRATPTYKALDDVVKTTLPGMVWVTFEGGQSVEALLVGGMIQAWGAEAQRRFGHQWPGETDEDYFCRTGKLSPGLRRKLIETGMPQATLRNDMVVYQERGRGMPDRPFLAAPHHPIGGRLPDSSVGVITKGVPHDPQHR